MVVRNLIGAAEAQEPAKTFNVVHPGTGEVVHAVEASREEDLARAVETAAEGFKTWKDTPLQERKEVFLKAADLLDDASSGWAQKLLNANTAETSCPRWWASEQVKLVPGCIRTLVGFADAALKEDTTELGDHTYHLSREPYGVCLAMAAWNAVPLLTMRAIVTPLLAGNTVVMKTSEQTPYSQALWAELLFAAGLPRDALCVVHVATADAPALTPPLVKNKRVRHVNFTGSTRVGSIIASLAGESLKPTLLELGGKAPVVILPDADLPTAATHILFGAFMNAGQICMSSERIIVPQSRYEAVVTELQKAWAAVEHIPRALFSSASASRVRDLITDAKSKGASDIFEANASPSGAANGHDDNHLLPLILGPVNAKMRLSSEESFGPLCVVIAVPDTGSEEELIDELVAVANDTDYGLSAAVWGADTARAEKVARRIEAGAVHVNSATVADPPVVPHGGWKSSGWGRFNGVEGIRSFTQMRSIEVPKGPAHPLPLAIFDL